MKKFIAFILFIMTLNILYAQGPWPELDDKTWEEMTVEKLESYLEEYSIHDRTKKGETALLFSVLNNENPSVIKALLEAGANPDARIGGDVSILMIAAGNNTNPEILRLLIKAGADVKARTSMDETALMFASNMNNNPEIIKLLIESGIDVNAKSKNNWTALMSAAGHNSNPKIVEILLDNGAKVNIENSMGEIAWDYIQDNEKLKDTKAYDRLKQLSN